MNLDTSALQALHMVFGGLSSPVTTRVKGRVHILSDKPPSPKPIAPIQVVKPLPVSSEPVVTRTVYVEPVTDVAIAPPLPPRIKRKNKKRLPPVARRSSAELISEFLSNPAFIAFANASVNDFQKETPAYAANIPSVMTTNKRSISDGTYCRA